MSRHIRLVTGPANGRTFDVSEDYTQMSVLVYCQPCEHAADQTPVTLTVTYAPIEGRPSDLWWPDQDIAAVDWDCQQCRVDLLRMQLSTVNKQVESVYEIHREIDADSDSDEPYVCAVCSRDNQVVAWPCPTLQALGSEVR